MQKINNINRTELIRLITRIENDKITEEELYKLYKSKPEICIGITGMPGAGKSCIINRVLDHFLNDGKRVGVLALDPVSPKSGGSILADRVRMQEHAADEKIFIRSLVNRNLSGSVDSIVTPVLKALSSAGFNTVIIETVGIGQAELSIKDFADLIIVVVPSDFGDKLQTIKSGILEIADILVVNKSDLSAAQHVFGLFESYLNDKDSLILVSAKNNDNISALYDLIKKTITRLTKSGDIDSRRRTRAKKELISSIYKEYEKRVLSSIIDSPEFKNGVEKILKDNILPTKIAKSLLEKYFY